MQLECLDYSGGKLSWATHGTETVCSSKPLWMLHLASSDKVPGGGKEAIIFATNSCILTDWSLGLCKISKAKANALPNHIGYWLDWPMLGVPVAHLGLRFSRQLGAVNFWKCIEKAIVSQTKSPFHEWHGPLSKQNIQPRPNRLALIIPLRPSHFSPLGASCSKCSLREGTFSETSR